jgi:hypothetical protein
VGIPKLEIHFKSRKIVASGKEAIDVVRWPIRICLVLVATPVPIVAWRAEPIAWATAAIAFVRSLL